MGSAATSLIHPTISSAAKTMLLFMSRGSLPPVLVGTTANSALDLVTRQSSGHISKHLVPATHVTPCGPHTMAIEKPLGWGTHCGSSIQSMQASGRELVTSDWEVRGPDPEKAGHVPGQASFCGGKMYGSLSAAVRLRLAQGVRGGERRSRQGSQAV